MTQAILDAESKRDQITLNTLKAKPTLPVLIKSTYLRGLTKDTVHLNSTCIEFPIQ